MCDENYHKPVDAATPAQEARPPNPLMVIGVIIGVLALALLAVLLTVPRGHVAQLLFTTRRQRVSTVYLAEVKPAYLANSATYRLPVEERIDPPGITRIGEGDVPLACSRDGRLVMFNGSVIGGKRSMNVVDLERHTMRVLRASALDFTTIDLCPDGREFAFTVSTGTRTRLYHAALDGGDPVFLRDEPGHIGEVCYAPDGTALYYNLRKGAVTNLYRIDMRSRECRQLTHFSDGTIVTPRISPDGRIIAFLYADFSRGTGTTYLYIANTDGTGLHAPAANINLECDMAFSPDSRTLLYTSETMLALEDGHWRRANTMYAVDLDTGNNHPLMTGNACYSSPACSPDGQFIACIITDERGDRILITNADGRNPRVLINARPETTVRWRP